MTLVIPTLALTTAFVVVAGAERFPRVQFRALPLLRPFLATDLAWYAVAVAASGVSAVVFRPSLSKLSIAPVAEWIARVPTWGRLLIAVAVYDLVAFAVHVAIHRSEVMWTVHKIHHSSLRLDWLATTRTHLFEHLVRNVPAQAALFLLGLSAVDITTAVAIYAGFALLGHSNLDLDLRFAEAVFITPRLHRRHHVPATTQKNYATVFSFWDRWFGSLIRIDTGPEEAFGVPGEVDTYPQRFADALREPGRQIWQTRRGVGRPTVSPRATG